MLSTTYKKASELAKKSSKAALSLVLLFFGFLGFNSLNNSSELPIQSVNEVQSISESALATPEESSPIPSQSSPASSTSPQANSKDVSGVVNVKAPVISFTGLDKDGIPTGFTITDSAGALGSLYISKRDPIFSESELTVSQIVKTDSGAANILISEQVISDLTGATFNFTLSYGKAGTWVPLNTKLAYFDTQRLIDGNYLLTAIIRVKSEVDRAIVLSSSANGRDLLEAPRQVITRIVLNPGKTEILAQAIQVIEKGAK